MSALTVDQLGTDLAEGRLDGMNALFEAQGEPPPQVIWAPSEDDLPDRRLRFLLRYWTGKCAGTELPSISAIAPAEMVPALGYVILLDVIDGGADFRYRLYGSEIASRTQTDWTGKRVSDIGQRSYTGRFYAAVYRAALIRRAPVATVSASPRYVAATRWSRIVLPLADAEGRVVRFLVGNVPGEWRRPEVADEW